jgi:uncharacterized protein (TIGR02118 family)
VVKLVCLLKRKPGMTPEEFQTYWRDVHGPLVASTRSASHVRRYEQHPAATPPGDDGWDGVTIQWFDSVDGFYASLREDDYKLIDEDTRRFLDVDRLQFVLTEEPRVVMS